MAEFNPYRDWLGIRTPERPPDHYQLLGLNRFEDDLEIIRVAADQRITYVRTFAIGAHGDLCQKMLNELSKAQRCLLNPKKKAAYDAALRARMPVEPATPHVAIPVAAPVYPAAAYVARAYEPPEAMPAQSAPSVGFELRNRRRRYRRELVVLVAAFATIAAFVVVVGRELAQRPKEAATARRSEPAPHGRRVPQKARTRISPTEMARPAPSDKLDSTQRADADASDHGKNTQPTDVDVTAVEQSQSSADTSDHNEQIQSTQATEAKSGQYVYLYDLPIFSSATGVAHPRTHDHGDEAHTPVTVRGKTVEHSLWVYPGVNQTGYVAFMIGKRYERLRGEVGLSDLAHGNFKGSLTFRVVGDGAELWHSRPVSSRVLMDQGVPGSASYPIERIDLDVASVDRLELWTDCSGPDDWAGAMYVDPILIAAPVLTPPGTDQFSEARNTVRLVFEKELREAENDERQRALAQTMMKRQAELANDIDLRFALLLEARDLLARSGDLAAASKAIEELARYDVDKNESWAEAMELAVVSGSFARMANVAQNAMSMVYDAVDAEKFAAAGSLAASAVAASRASKSTRLLARAEAVSADIAGLQQEFEAVRAVQGATPPLDSTAKGAVGRYLCFAKGDWERGLPLLAEADDAELAEIARLELEVGDLAEGQAACGDRWWRRATQQIGLRRKNLLLRAAHWYRLAKPRVAESERARIQRRLSEMDFVFVFDGNCHILTRLERFAPVTIEVWVLPAEWQSHEVHADGEHDAGTIVGSDIPNNFGIGVALYDRHLFLEILKAHLKTDRPVAALAWSHVSVVFGSSSSTVFHNGKRCYEGPATEAAPGTPFVVGMWGADNPSARFMGKVGAVRISEGERYDRNFAPPRIFVSDTTTALILDPSDAEGNVAVDGSGRGKHGSLEGVKVEMEADLFGELK